MSTGLRPDVNHALGVFAESKPLWVWMLYEVGFPVGMFVPIVVVSYVAGTASPFAHVFAKGELLLVSGMLVIFAGMEIHEVDHVLRKLNHPRGWEWLCHVYLWAGFLLLAIFAANVGMMTLVEQSPHPDPDHESKKVLWSLIGTVGMMAGVLLAWGGRVAAIRRLCRGV